jgi:hypothetical protein
VTVCIRVMTLSRTNSVADGVKNVYHGYGWVSMNRQHSTSESVPLLLRQTKWPPSVLTIIHDGIPVRLAYDVSDGIVKRVLTLTIYALEVFTVWCHECHCTKKCRALFVCCSSCTFRSIVAAIMRSSPTAASEYGGGWHLKPANI